MRAKKKSQEEHYLESHWKSKLRKGDIAPTTTSLFRMQILLPVRL